MVFNLNKKTTSTKQKLIYILKKNYGIGLQKSFFICDQLNINPSMKRDELSEDTFTKLINFINKKILIDKKLKKIKKNYINDYKENGSLKGFRHKRHLPVRGQRTHSNAKTPKRLANIIKKK